MRVISLIIFRYAQNIAFHTNTTFVPLTHALKSHQCFRQPDVHNRRRQFSPEQKADVERKQLRTSITTASVCGVFGCVVADMLKKKRIETLISPTQKNPKTYACLPTKFTNHKHGQRKKALHPHN